MRATVVVCKGAPSSVLAPHLVEYEAWAVPGLRALEEEGDLAVVKCVIKCTFLTSAFL